MDNLVEALYYKKIDENNVICELCPHKCIISLNKEGLCRVRRNIKGKLYTLNYGAVAAYSFDPIEKKPLNNFYPGNYIFSVGTFGCNLKCDFCQNYKIAHKLPEYTYVNPSQLINIALKHKHNLGIAFTYNEPSIWYEYILETAKLSKAKGLKNVLVTNGYIEQKPFERLLEYIDAVNIDLKAFSEKFYQEICKGRLVEVKKNIVIASRKCHVEISTLLIDELNTDEDEIVKLSEWLSNIDKNIPLHLNRYFPSYKMSNKPTELKTLRDLKKISKKYLNRVYIGNI